MLVAALSVVVTAGAPASAADARTEQYRYALETLTLPTAEFERRADAFLEHGCTAGSAGCGAPAPYNGFDWTTDGCTGVKALPKLTHLYDRLFHGPCRLHDFGYRNFGRGLTLQRTEEMRAVIDRRFLDEMRALCRARYPVETARVRRAGCLTEAQVMHAVVRVALSWR